MLNEEMMTELNFEFRKEEKIFQERGDSKGKGPTKTTWKIIRYKKETIPIEQKACKEMW